MLALIFNWDGYWFALKQVDDGSALSVNLVTHLGRALIIRVILRTQQETRQGPL